jgi:1,2-diacylglycerol 3-alpha-glucosyltransferase
MSDALNIAFFTDSFLPATDGVVTSILGFRKELERRGHSVYVFASGNSKTKRMTENDKNVFVMRGVRFKKYPQYNLALFPFMASLKLRGKRMDILHAQTPFIMGMYSMLMARSSGIPLVGSFHTLFTDKEVISNYTADSKLLIKLLTRYAWPYARFFYSKCDEVIAPSDVIKGMLEKHHIGNISTVPNGIDPARFNGKVDGSKLRESLTGRSGDSIVLYVGRLSKEKRIDTLLKAARLLKGRKIKFIIGGTGPAADAYQRMARSMRLDNVKFTGFISDEQLPEYYAACDLFCLPSTFDTQGIVSIEAMACNKPVVGANYLALKELIKNGYNGEKFVPMSASSCAEKIGKVLNHLDSYKGMLNTAKQYSVARVTDRLLDVYKKAIDDSTNMM